MSNIPQYRIRKDDYYSSNYRIDMLVSSKGYYITLPYLFETLERAKEEVKKLKKYG